MFGMGNDGAGGGMAAGFEMVTTEELLGEYKSQMDVFSYHYYNGVSDSQRNKTPSDSAGVRKTVNPPYEIFIGRIFAYSFDAEASEGGFGAVQNRRSYNTPIGV